MRSSRCNQQPIASNEPHAISPMPCVNSLNNASGPKSHDNRLHSSTELLCFLTGDSLMASIRTASTTEHLGRKNTAYELDNYGIKAPARVYWNLNTPELYEE